MSDLAQICIELFRVLLEEEISNFGVLQAPRPTAVGHSGIVGGGAMPLPPGTIWVCDSDLEAPTDGSSAGQRSHMWSELKAGKTKNEYTERKTHNNLMNMGSITNTEWTAEKYNMIQEWIKDVYLDAFGGEIQIVTSVHMCYTHQRLLT